MPLVEHVALGSFSGCASRGLGFFARRLAGLLIVYEPLAPSCSVATKSTVSVAGS